MVAAYRMKIFKVLGIEAVRKTVEKEINAELKFYSLYVNYRLSTYIMMNFIKSIEVLI